MDMPSQSHTCQKPILPFPYATTVVPKKKAHIYFLRSRFQHALSRAHKLEPIRPAIFLKEPLLPVREATLDTASALWGVGAVEVGDVLIAYVSEPVGIIC